MPVTANGTHVYWFLMKRGLCLVSSPFKSHLQEVRSQYPAGTLSFPLCSYL